MPYKSRAQAAYFNIHKKELERQGVSVSEWNAASKGMKLPKHKREDGGSVPKLNYPALLRDPAPAVNYFGDHPYGLYGKHGLDASIPLGDNTFMTGRASMAPNLYGPDRHDYGFRLGIKQRFADGGGATVDPISNMLRKFLMDEISKFSPPSVNPPRGMFPGNDQMAINPYDRYFHGAPQEFQFNSNDMPQRGANVPNAPMEIDPTQPRQRYGVPPEFEPFTGQADLPVPPRRAAIFDQLPEAHRPFGQQQFSPFAPQIPQRAEGGPAPYEPFGGETYDANAPEPIPTDKPSFFQQLGDVFSQRPEDYGGKTSHIYKLGRHLLEGAAESAKGTMEASENLRQTGEYDAKEPFMAALNTAGMNMPFAMMGKAGLSGGVGTFGNRLFSPVERAVEREGPKHGTSAEWLAFLENRPGIKKSEIEQMGLKEFLAKRGEPIGDPGFTGRVGLMGHNMPPPEPASRITRNEMLNEINKRRLEYTEQIFKEPKDRAFSREMEERYGSYNQHKWTPEERAEYDRLSNEAYNLPSDQRDPATSFHAWKLPGTKDYTERVVNLSPPAPSEKAIELHARKTAEQMGGRGHWERLDDADRADYRDIAKRKLTEVESHGFETPIKSYNMHLREDSHVIDGIPTKNLDELQSDLYQRLRDKGAFDPEKMAKADEVYQAAKSEHEKIDDAFRNNVSNLLHSEEGRLMSREARDAMYDAFRNIRPGADPRQIERVARDLPDQFKGDFIKARESLERQIAAHREYLDATENMGTPQVPMSNTTQWAGIGLKRFLHDAAEKDFAQISWPAGEEQTRRYWGPKPNRLQQTMTYDKDAKQLFGFAPDGYGGEKLVLNKKYTSPEKLEALVGKELADKLIATGKGNTYGQKGMVKLDQPLDIALPGMEGFYDKVVFNLMNDYGKKYGVKAVKREIEIPRTRRDVMKEFPNYHEQQVMDYLRANPTRKTSVFVMELPEKMRAAILNKTDAKLSGMYKGGAVIKRAFGGPTSLGSFGQIPSPDRKKPNIVNGGLLHSDVPGRTDDLSISVPSGAYVIPADIVAGEGQGNTIAGSKKIHSMFSGPLGLPTLKKKARSGKIGAGHLARLRAGHLPRGSRIKAVSAPFAEGGAPEVNEGEETPILAAGGEYIVHPHVVRKLGRGDLKQGHQILDAFVLHARNQHVKQIKNLKPPVKT